MESDRNNNKEGASGVSFTLKKTKTTKLKPVQLDKEEATEFVYSVEGSQIESSAPAVKEKTEYVIPLIAKTKWRMPKSVVGGSSTGKTETGRQEEGEKTEKTEEELQLEKEAIEAVWTDVREGESRKAQKEEQTIPLLLHNKPPILEGQSDSVLADVELRPEPSSRQEYTEMPIEEFGKAMIRGMGWKEGEAIGNTNKGLVEPIEYIGNVPGLGLGAIPKPAAPPKKSDGYRNIRKPGEEPKKVPRRYVDKDGRVRHIKKIGEEIPEQPAQGFVVGNYAKVVAGRHEDLYGKIVMVDEDTGGVFLKLAINSQVERFSQHHLELVTREEYRLGRPPDPISRPLEEEQEEEDRTSEKKQYGLIRMKDGHKIPSSTESSTARQDNRGQGSSDHRQKANKHSRSASSRHEPSDRSPESKRVKRDDRGERGGAKSYDKHRHTERSEDHRSHGNDRVEEKHRSGNRHHESKKLHKKTSTHHRAETRESSHLRAGKEVEPEEEAWLCRDLVVKVTDRQYKKGRHYNTKVTVLDMVSRRRCVCQTADRHLLEGLEQNMLETVVPRASYSSIVKVVRGERKGELGIVVEQDRERATAVVQLRETKEVLNLDFDDICQYVGTDAEDETM